MIFDRRAEDSIPRQLATNRNFETRRNGIWLPRESKQRKQANATVIISSHDRASCYLALESTGIREIAGREIKWHIYGARGGGAGWYEM